MCVPESKTPWLTSVQVRVASCISSLGFTCLDMFIYRWKWHHWCSKVVLIYSDVFTSQRWVSPYSFAPARVSLYWPAFPFLQYWRQWSWQSWYCNSVDPSLQVAEPTWWRMATLLSHKWSCWIHWCIRATPGFGLCCTKYPITAAQKHTTQYCASYSLCKM